METDRKLHPLILGATLALTIATMYILCTVAWSIWHEAMLDFLNALFHGLDFRQLRFPESAYSIRLFVLPLAVLTAWGFVTGVLYAGIYNLLKRWARFPRAERDWTRS